MTLATIPRYYTLIIANIRGTYHPMNEKTSCSKMRFRLSECEKLLKSEVPENQLVAVMQIPSIIRDYPFPAVLHGLLSKLSILFVNCNSSIRCYIAISIQQSKRYLLNISNIEEIIDVFYSVLHSNDPLARSATFFVFSALSSGISANFRLNYDSESASGFCKEIVDISKIYHSVLCSLTSSDYLELEAALVAGQSFAISSPEFAITFYQKVIDLFELPTYFCYRKKFLLAISKLGCHSNIVERAWTYCTGLTDQSYLPTIVIVSTTLALNSSMLLSSHLDFLLDRIKNISHSSSAGDSSEKSLYLYKTCIRQLERIYSRHFDEIKSLHLQELNGIILFSQNDQLITEYVLFLCKLTKKWQYVLNGIQNQILNFNFFKMDELLNIFHQTSVENYVLKESLGLFVIEFNRLSGSGHSIINSVLPELFKIFLYRILKVVSTALFDANLSKLSQSIVYCLKELNCCDTINSIISGSVQTLKTISSDIHHPSSWFLVRFIFLCITISPSSSLPNIIEQYQDLKQIILSSSFSKTTEKSVKYWISLVLLFYSSRICGDIDQFSDSVSSLFSFFHPWDLYLCAVKFMTLNLNLEAFVIFRFIADSNSTKLSPLSINRINSLCHLAHAEYSFSNRLHFQALDHLHSSQNCLNLACASDSQNVFIHIRITAVHLFHQVLLQLQRTEIYGFSIHVIEKLKVLVAKISLFTKSVHNFISSMLDADSLSLLKMTYRHKLLCLLTNFIHFLAKDRDLKNEDNLNSLPDGMILISKVVDLLKDSSRFNLKIYVSMDLISRQLYEYQSYINENRENPLSSATLLSQIISNTILTPWEMCDYFLYKSRTSSVQLMLNYEQNLYNDEFILATDQHVVKISSAFILKVEGVLRADSRNLKKVDFTQVLVKASVSHQTACGTAVYGDEKDGDIEIYCKLIPVNDGYFTDVISITFDRCETSIVTIDASQTMDSQNNTWIITNGSKSELVVKVV